MELDIKQQANKATKDFQEALPNFILAFNNLSSVISNSIKNMNIEEAKKLTDEMKKNPKEIEKKLSELNISIKDLNDKLKTL